MKTKRKILTLLLVGMTMIYNIAFGQISQGGVPYSFEADYQRKSGTGITLSDTVPMIKMPQINKATIDSIKEQNTKGPKVFQFAYGFETDINVKTASAIDSLEIGLLYRLSVKSTGAYSINLIFKKYKLPKGAKLFIYSKDKKDLKGAFTSNNNNNSEILPTTPVTGDEIIVEYFEPYFSEFKGELKIGKISHDFLDILNFNKDDDFGNSGDCNVDINCPEGNDWQQEKHAVCKIIIDGSGLCTGTLINNTANDGTPYFLTANHCINNQSDAENSVYIFNYESPICNGGDGSVYQSISGANLRANRSQSDFSLLELFKKPLSTYTPFYAGWDNQDIVKNNVVGIHHPSGDVKKICVENDNIQPADYLSNTIDNSANHWRVADWDVGVTEGGSSGSALFDNDHRIIGQLHGGDAACNGNTDNDEPDWYGKFSTSWDEGNSSNNRLRDWLDPNNNTLTLDGISGCDQGIKVNLNITHTITDGSVELHQATNTITANNTVESGATATYEAETVILTDGFTAEAGSDFTARSRTFDCVVTCDPMNLTAWTSFVCGGDDLCFNITNAENFTISVFDAGGSLVHQNSGSINGNSVCVWNTAGVATGIYNATVSFSTDCQEISNTYQLLVASCKKSANNTSDTFNSNIDKKEITNIAETENSDLDLKIFPNPNEGSFKVEFSRPLSTPYSFQIINASGAVIYNIEYLNAKTINVEQKGLPTGIYYVRVLKGTSDITKKVIIKH